LTTAEMRRTLATTAGAHPRVITTSPWLSAAASLRDVPVRPSIVQ